MKRKLIRLLSIVLVLSSLLGLWPQMSTTVYAASSSAQAIVDEAVKHTGEKYYNFAIEGTDFDAQYAWCAHFVTWCARETGLSDLFGLGKNKVMTTITQIAKHFIKTGKGTFYYYTDTYADNNEAYKYLKAEKVASNECFDTNTKNVSRNSFVPQVGDLIIFLWPTESLDGYDHIGFVQAVDKKNQKVTYVDGNTGTRNWRTSTVMSGRTRSFSDKAIVAYIRPKYCSSHTYDSLGVCTKCSSEYVLTENDDAMGVYAPAGVSAVMRKTPYGAAKKTATVLARSSVKVLYSAKNAGGETWLYGTYNKVNGWFRADDLKYVKDIPSDVTFSSKTPSTLKEGTSWPVKGTIQSVYKIKSVVGKIINADTGDAEMTTSKGKPGSGTPTKYLLSGTCVDNGLKFGKLDPGSYYYTLTVTDTKGYTETWKSGTFQVTSSTASTCAKPKFQEKLVEGGKEITISSTTSGATISWTYGDKKGSGKTPVKLTLTASAKITASASKSGMSKSAEVKKNVSVSICESPQITAGTLSANGMQVVIEGASGQTLYYSVNGQAFQKYTAPFCIKESATVRAYAVKKGSVNSETAMKSLVFTAPDTPVPSLVSTDSDIAQGTAITVGWDKVDYATSYTVSVVCNGEQLEEKEMTAASYTFPASQEGIYLISVKAVNTAGESAYSKTIAVTAHGKQTVTFTHEDGTVLSTQQVSYGGEAVEPEVIPSKPGYTFTGWSQSLDNITTDTTICAEFKINVYTVRYYDCDGITLLGTQQAEYGQPIDASMQDRVSLNTGYSFVGWHVREASSNSKLDLNAIDCNMSLVAAQQWEIGDLPIVVSIQNAVRNSECTGYDVELALTCAPASVIGGDTQKAKIIVSLKSEDDQMLATSVETVNLTQAQQSLTRSVFVSYDGSYLADCVEVAVVGIDGHDRTGGALAEVVSAEPTVTTTWSAWSTEKPEGVEYETKTQYRYTDYTRSTASVKTSTSDTPTKSGWTHIGYTTAWGSWSSWSDTAITATSNREVKTQKVQTAAAYKQYRYGRWYCSSTGWAHFCKELGTSQGNGSSWAKKYTSWSKTKTSPTATNYWKCSYASHDHVNPSKTSGSTDYWNKYSIDGKSYYWEETRTVAAKYKTQYAYRDKIYTHSFEKWTAGTASAWSDTVYTSYTQTDSKRTVETRTLYRYITNDTTVTPLENVTESYSFSGQLNPDSGVSYAGKRAAVLVYKQTNSDPTEPQLEYVGETILGENNSYSFSVRPKEEPSAATGDFIVALALQGSSNVVNTAKIMAPAERYTVTFYDHDGTVLNTQTVTEGGSAAVPDSPDREGYRFICWSTDLTDVRRDLNVNAVYVPEEYSVAFVDFENRTITMDTDYIHGTVLLTPDAPACEGMVFSGWQVTYNTTGETAAMTEAVTVTDDMIVSAQWTPVVYEVAFLNQSGDVLETQSVAHGQAAELPEYTSVPSGMEFLGWSNETKWWNVTSDMEVHPIVVYEETTTAPLAEEREVEGVSDSIELTSEDGAVIYYTTDGSDPEPGMDNTFVYTEPIYVDADTQIRAVAVKENKNASEIVSVSFWYMDELEEFPVEDTLNVGIYNIEAVPGNTVEMQLNIENNPGLAAFLFYVDADTTVFSVPTDAETGESGCTAGAVCASGSLLVASYEDGLGWPILWFGAEASTENGTLCTLTLQVAEDAETGTYPITVRYSPANTFDADYISQDIPGLSAGFSGATEYKMGDVDGDGAVTNKDVVLIARWIIGAVKIAEERQFLMDVNADGSYTVADALYLARYLIGLEYTLGGL